jgi:hypothetical protein
MVIEQLKTTCNYKRRKKDSTVKIKKFKRSLIRTKKATFFFSVWRYLFENCVGGKQHIMEKN